jgi:hypothetical protein
MEELNKEINVQELIDKATENTICYIEEMHPIYQQGPDGHMYSCAMSNVFNSCPSLKSTRELFNNEITGETINKNLKGCCARIYLSSNYHSLYE